MRLRTLSQWSGSSMFVDSFVGTVRVASDASIISTSDGGRLLRSSRLAPVTLWPRAWGGTQGLRAWARGRLDCIGRLDESDQALRLIKHIAAPAPRYDRREYLPRTRERLQRLAE